MKHLITLRETSADDIRSLLDTAAVFKEIVERPVKKVPTLRGRAMITLFYENSTRTRTSFEMAAKIMSAEAINIAVAQSSVSKGESLKDTILTLQSLKADCIVMRHSASGAAQFAAEHLRIPVVNAGDGRHEHPTQGLLDMLTIRQNKGDLDGLTVAIVGDITHSRVARSNIWGLTKMGAKVRLVGPRTLMPLDACQLPVQVYDDLRTGLEGVDVVNVLRLQTERMDKGLLPSLREYARLFGISVNSLKAARPDVLVMHPGPMNRGVEISADVADGAYGINSVIGEQVTNGVAVRMAVLYLLMGVQTEGLGTGD
ncbi:MAG TPA: aspartate carbamoyltransferase catalytic subunit [Chthonomonadaceae bacterium]|nr:aspartate carbamoyltransferase catalytic subunit [Chthonomonadaceae bacterium]